MTNDKIFNNLLNNELLWFPRKGVGYFPVKESDEPYDASYFEKYQSYEDTEIGVNLNKQRVEFVERFFTGKLLDVGIGCGSFIKKYPHGAIGTDVNPEGVKWLTTKNIMWSGEDVEAATFWDSLEHIKNPDDILGKVGKWIFVSIPIFSGLSDLLNSKHFRTDEHRWYFTKEGFVDWMKEKGFQEVFFSEFENKLGREGIGSFVFKRV